jgi:isoleucyl-tRNA synthetase
MPGWLVATEGTLTVALDIVQTPELILEGTARELIHPVQNIRKESGFSLTDRIDTFIYADGAVHEAISKALAAHGMYVAAQTLSKSLVLRPLAEAPEDAATIQWEDTSIRIKLNRI